MAPCHTGHALCQNSRTHSDEQVVIAASIKEFGWINPILYEAGTIIAGHGRLMAAQRLGHDQVPTITLAHPTDAQKRAYVIADNKLALNAGWDAEMLAVEVEELLDQVMTWTLPASGPTRSMGPSQTLTRWTKAIRTRTSSRAARDSAQPASDV